MEEVLPHPCTRRSLPFSKSGFSPLEEQMKCILLEERGIQKEAELLVIKVETALCPKLALLYSHFTQGCCGSGPSGS